MFGHSNYVCTEKTRVLASQMTEILSLTRLFITCDQVIGLRVHIAMCLRVCATANERALSVAEWIPRRSRRTPSGLRADSGGAAGLRSDSGGAPPKYIPNGLKTILADSGGLRADSSGLQADFKVRRGLRAAPRRTGGVSAAD